MAAPTPLPFELALGPFRVEEAAAFGIMRSRLRANDLSSPHHGVRMLGRAGVDIDERAAAFLPLLRRDEVFSHVTAALLLGLRLPLRLQTAPLHVTVITEHRTDGVARARRRPGVIGHRADHRETAVSTTGFPVTDAIATWLDLAPMLSVEEIIVAGDGLVRRRHPLAEPRELVERVESTSRLRGIRAIRTAMPFIRPRTDSGRETQLRLLLVSCGIREPEVNGAIEDEAGRIIAHGDLVWRHERVIVEYEGDHHRTDRRQFSIDIDRIGRLEAAGWRVIRVDAALFARPDALVPRIRPALTTSR